MSNLNQRLPGPFASLAVKLREIGLCPIPCGGEHGKKPLLRTARWSGLPSQKSIADLAARPSFACSELGLLTGLSGLTIVDCDDSTLFEAVLRCCGPTAVITATPSGGFHFWYRSSGEGCKNLCPLGLKIDIRGRGGLVVVPPIRTSALLCRRAFSDVSDIDRLMVLFPDRRQPSQFRKSATRLRSESGGVRDPVRFFAKPMTRSPFPTVPSPTTQRSLSTPSERDLIACIQALARAAAREHWAAVSAGPQTQGERP